MRVRRVLGIICAAVTIFSTLGLTIMTLQFGGTPSRSNKVVSLAPESTIQSLKQTYRIYQVLAPLCFVLSIVFLRAAKRQQ